jgi:2,3-diketo-5-methylthiopentyl-1-phosphate enolase
MQLHKELQKYYPDISDDELVTVIEFEPVRDTEEGTMQQVKVLLRNIKKRVSVDSTTFRSEPFTSNEFDELLAMMCRDAGPGTWSEFRGLERVDIDLARLKKSHTVEASNGNSDAGTVTLSFPESNFDMSYNGLPHLLGTVAGDILSLCEARGAYPEIEDIHLPSSLAEQLPGPNLGIDRLRQLIRVADRPLLAFTAKPRLGLTNREFATLCAEASLGGADIVEDDERLGNQAASPLLERISAVREVFGRVGASALYSVNITGREDRIVEMAERAVAAGAQMLKIDVPPVSFAGLQAVAEHLASKKIIAPITVYPGFLYMYRSLSRKVVLKLIRLCGGDIVYAGTPSFGGEIGRHDVVRSLRKAQENHNALKGDLESVQRRQSLPTVSTSIHPGNAGILYRTLGRDIAYFVGGAIAGWPDGPREGAAAMLKAIRSAVQKEDMPAFDAKERRHLDDAGWHVIGFADALKKYPDIRDLPEAVI